MKTKGGYHYVCEKHHRPIPPQDVVRIVNRDLRDARIENLEVLSLSEWTKRFSPPPQSVHRAG
jgi:hypothetical protein